MKVWHLLLLPLTPLYAGVVRARAAAYRRGLLATVRLPVPVVSVGNLTFGGTGKTPTVIALVRDLVKRGRRPAVLTRGYGRRGTAPVVVLGPGPGLSAAVAGDEPLELAERLPGVPVVVDHDRARGGYEAIRLGADTLVLDDGFQHLRLARDLDLVVVDAGNPWGGGKLPPGGRLREPLSALARASAVLITKLSAEPEPQLAEVAVTVHRVAPGLPVLGSRLRLNRVHTPDGWRSPADLAGRRVFVFAGVGRPQGFADLLADHGANVVATRWFRDHHRYEPGEAAALVTAASARDAVAVTTAKDAVKLPPGCAAWVVEVAVEPLAGSWDGLWERCPELAGDGVR